MVELELAEDPAMLELLAFLRGWKFQAIAAWMWEDDNYVQLYRFLREHGIDMDAIFAWVSDQLGMHFTPPAKRSENLHK